MDELIVFLNWLDFFVSPACYRQKLTWSNWAKKRAAIKMGFEDNHD
jgi:hypothetical protein